MEEKDNEEVELERQLKALQRKYELVKKIKKLRGEINEYVKPTVAPVVETQVSVVETPVSTVVATPSDVLNSKRIAVYSNKLISDTTKNLKLYILPNFPPGGEQENIKSYAKGDNLVLHKVYKEEEIMFEQPTNMDEYEKVTCFAKNHVPPIADVLLPTMYRFWRQYGDSATSKLPIYFKKGFDLIDLIQKHEKNAAMSEKKRANKALYKKKAKEYKKKLKYDHHKDSHPEIIPKKTDTDSPNQEREAVDEVPRLIQSDEVEEADYFEPSTDSDDSL